MSVAELNESPAGIALSGPLARLSSGVLDKLLFRASERVDGRCKKRIQSPALTTVAAPGISAGGTSLPVASTLTFDNKEDNGVILGTGASQEILQIVPGGVSVSSYTSPYPGTLTLATGCAYGHSAGDSVQGCYMETTEALSASSSEVYSEVFTQEAQLAMAHAPLLGKGANLTRLVFLKNYPIVTILKVEHAYPFSNQYGTLLASTTLVEGASGFYRLSLGSIVIPQGMIRTSYLAGYQVVPDDIKEATSYYLADSLAAMFNFRGGIELTQGKDRIKYTDGKSKSYWVQKAEEILIEGNYIRKT